MGAKVSSEGQETKQEPQVKQTEVQKTVALDSFFGIDVEFDDVQLGDAIGHGTYGKVFKGEYDGYKVAVKKLFMSNDPEERSEILEDFSKELSILSKLKHRCIVQFLGAVRVDPNFCLIFELCEGSVGSLLATARANQVHITFGMCLRIAQDCAEAMTYLHNLSPKILHRDLKAENLLLDRNFNCKLTDFGLSRGYEGKSVMTICGTPCWVAPEIFRGEAYTEAVDVYSYSVVLWELFCFEKPYAEQDAVELPFLVAKENLRPPLLAHCPKDINNLMEVTWDADMNKRPSFEEIGKRLIEIESNWKPFISKTIDPTETKAPC